jgi:hypothetical protein
VAGSLISAAGLALMDDATAADQRTTLGGVVVGPASVTAERIAVFDGVTGKLIKAATEIVSDLVHWGTPAYVDQHLAMFNAIGELEDASVSATAVSGALQCSGGTMSGNIILGENTAIALDPAGSADEKWSGITVSGTAGATLAVGDLCYLDVTAAEWLLADADAAATSGSVVLGICILAGGNAEPTKMLLMGTVRSAAFPASIALGAPVYVSTTAGDITATQPTGTDDVIRVVGWAVTVEPNTIYFNPSPDYITHT